MSEQLPDSATADDGLNTLLAAYAISDPSPALRERILSAAPRARAVGRVWRWLAGAGLGLGLAGSAAAGVAVGYSLGHPAAARLIGPSELDAGQVSSLADPAVYAADG
jgi:hypothetical protein